MTTTCFAVTHALTDVGVVVEVRVTTAVAPPTLRAMGATTSSTKARVFTAKIFTRSLAGCLVNGETHGAPPSSVPVSETNVADSSVCAWVPA